MGVEGAILSSRAVALFYLGLTFGDFGSGFGSQLIKSRRKTVFAFLVFSAVCVGVYLMGTQGWTATSFYGLIFLLGLGMGYWAIFVTIAAEQFGTNLRATVATTVPNFARGSLVLLTLGFTWLTGTKDQPWLSAPQAAGVLALICFGAAFLALWKMEETYGKDLDYQEKK
jgi:MFS family permease